LVPSRVFLALDTAKRRIPSRMPMNRSVARRLVVAATLLARDPAAVVPFNRGGHHAAALSWADGDATRADANCGVGVVPPTTVPIVAIASVPSDLNIDLGHLDALGLGRSGEGAVVSISIAAAAATEARVIFIMWESSLD